MRWPPNLKDEAEKEAYEYFDKHIRPLPKKVDGSIDTLHPKEFFNTDVDAFRHAYVSGIFTHEYGEKAATRLGWMNEFFTITPGTKEEDNMDFWNNAVGRELAGKHKTKGSLAQAVKDALSQGRLITVANDNRVYHGPDLLRPSLEFSVIVLKENENGVNEIFFDLSTSKVMSKYEFVAAIEAGQYSGYTVRVRGGIKFPVSRRDGADNLD